MESSNQVARSRSSTSPLSASTFQAERSPDSPSPSPTARIAPGATLPLSAKSHALATHSRSNSVRKSPLNARMGSHAYSPSISNKTTRDDSTLELDEVEYSKCNRERLIEIAARQKRELEDAVERGDKLEERRGTWVRETVGLNKDLAGLRSRISAFMSEQARMEEELAGRVEVLEKLRTTAREAERDKRESEKRYREQTSSFEAERQSWYDQEQHYKLRISNLSAAPRKARLSEPPKPREEFDPNTTPKTPTNSSPRSYSPSPSTGPSASEIEAQNQLVSLTTAHSSLTTTLRTLQVELADLKRVYRDLQEENESYEILLGERTMNGEIRDSSLLRNSWAGSEEGSSLNGSIPGGLVSVGEDSEEIDSEEDELERSLRQSKGMGSPVPTKRSGPGRGKVVKQNISGGLDLEAEMEAAQMADEEASTEVPKGKKHKREKSSTEVLESTLRAELKSLREANKALTLYVSKIVDRVCSQEGFEKVLAVDYKLGSSPTKSVFPEISPVMSHQALGAPPAATGRLSPRGPTTLFRGNNSTSTTSRLEIIPSVPVNIPPIATHNSKDRSRKTLSLGWDSVSSAFASALSRAPVVPSPTTQPAGFKPFMLSSDNPNSTAAPSGTRKLETEEDADDLRERERLKAEMALHGFGTPGAGNRYASNSNSSATATVNTSSLLNSPSITSGPLSVSPSSSFNSGFRRTPLPSPSAGQSSSEEEPKTPEQKLLHLQAKEREALKELDQGRASGFTEIQQPRRPRPESMIRIGSNSSETAQSGVRGLGLGISDTAGSKMGVEQKSVGEGGGSAEVEGTEDAGWATKLKRMSMGWSATPPNQS